MKRVVKTKKPAPTPKGTSTGLLGKLVGYLFLLGQGVVGASNDGSPNTGLDNT